MRTPRTEIDIELNHIKDDLILTIYENKSDTLSLIDETEAFENSESPVQLLEGRFYAYEFNDETYRLTCQSEGIVSISKTSLKSSGEIAPNIFVGTLCLDVYNATNCEKKYPVYLEVLPTKLNSGADENYRENYRYMLEDITRKCTELLMQINSPIIQNFEVDHNLQYKSRYQQFCFVQSLINSDDFNEAVQKIISSPTTKWAEDFETRDIRGIRKVKSSTIRQIISGSKRFPLPDHHFLSRNYGINSIPSKISCLRKVESVDTPENRFVKHSLEVFLKFCTECEEIFREKKYFRPQKEALNLIHHLENHLSNPFFKDISRPSTLKLNSPVLQRKSGYREILKSWLSFWLASKLVWDGGEKIYEAGKRNIAVLYEYWLFFILHDLVRKKFGLKVIDQQGVSYDHLIVPTKDGLNVMIESGKHTSIRGVYDSGKRKLKIKFSYNLTFSGGKDYIDKVRGSWTKSLRPDYTLSIWPADFDESVAEEKELITHIHFDSKYKVDQFVPLPNDGSQSDEEKELEKEKEEELRGNYRNGDLLKMHAYKDAIRRTGGAYILYPGTGKPVKLRGFHEIIPGLGAFAIRPAQEDNGIADLSAFIDDVIFHFLDRASQRENISSKVYTVHKNKKEDRNILDEIMPEYIGEDKIIPEDVFVLVGFSKSPKHFKWYSEKKKYNFRMDDDNGSLVLDNEVVNAKYLLLRKSGSETASDIYKIVGNGPKVYSGEKLKELGYPNPSKDYYLVIETELIDPVEFGSISWNFKQLEKYQQIISQNTNPRIGPGIPFTVSLKELMKVKVK